MEQETFIQLETAKPQFTLIILMDRQVKNPYTFLLSESAKTVTAIFFE